MDVYLKEEENKICEDDEGEIISGQRDERGGLCEKEEGEGEGGGKGRLSTWSSGGRWTGVNKVT